MIVLPPEVCAHIVRHSAPPDLLSLCRASKALQRAAESRLYEGIFLREASTAYHVCQSLVANDGLRGAYLRRFWFHQETRSTLPPRFWQAIRAALETMVNLETLYIYEPTTRNSWILNSPEITFRLREATLILAWDANMVAFLQTQSRLRFLRVEDSLEVGPLCSVAPDKLPSLTHFNGPLLVLVELSACPLTHIQIILEDETAPILPTVVTDLGKVKKGLRALSIMFMPEQLVLDTLQLVSTSVFSSGLRYLGTLPYPMLNRHEVHRCLIRMSALETIDLDLSTWLPQPIDLYQKMLAAELRTFCPSLLYVGFWYRQHRFLWFRQEDEWMCGQLSNRSPINESLWRTA